MSVEAKFGFQRNKLAIGVFLTKDNFIKRIDIGGKISIDEMIIHLKGLKERLREQKIKEVN